MAKEDQTDYLYSAFSDVANGHDIHSVMVALGALYADIVGSITTDEQHIRDLYQRMATAAVYLAQLNDSDELQAEEDPPQKKKAKKARSKTGDEPGPFGSH